MRTLLIAANGVAVLGSILCASQLYRTRWRSDGPRAMSATFIILGLTVVVSTLAFLLPAWLQALRRDGAGLSQGEWWRLVTPLFVQPGGWIQFVINVAFLATFLPIAGRLHRAGLWFIYLGSGIAGQAVNYLWSPQGGGSSTAAFGTMGSLLVFILWTARATPLPYRVFAGPGLGAGLVMSLGRDGHGPGLLTGALVAAAMLATRGGAEAAHR